MVIGWVFCEGNKVKEISFEYELFIPAEITTLLYYYIYVIVALIKLLTVKICCFFPFFFPLLSSMKPSYEVRGYDCTLYIAYTDYTIIPTDCTGILFCYYRNYCLGLISFR